MLYLGIPVYIIPPWDYIDIKHDKAAETLPISQDSKFPTSLNFSPLIRSLIQLNLFVRFKNSVNKLNTYQSLLLYLNHMV